MAVEYEGACTWIERAEVSHNIRIPGTRLIDLMRDRSRAQGRDYVAPQVASVAWGILAGNADKLAAALDDLVTRRVDRLPDMLLSRRVGCRVHGQP